MADPVSSNLETFLRIWMGDGRLQTYEDRERFRAQAGQMLASLPPETTENERAALKAVLGYPGLPAVIYGIVRAGLIRAEEPEAPHFCCTGDYPCTFATETTERMRKGRCIYCGLPEKASAECRGCKEGWQRQGAWHWDSIGHMHECTAVNGGR